MSRIWCPVVLALCLANGASLAFSNEPDTSHDAATFADQVASIVNQGISDGEMPGAVVVVADQSRVLYQQAFGDRQVAPTREPMTTRYRL